MSVEMLGIAVAIVASMGAFAAFVLAQAKAQVLPVKALAETTNQSLLAHQEEDRENYLDLKQDLREIKDLLRENAKGPVPPFG